MDEPLTHLTKATVWFDWGFEQELALKLLKEQLCTALILQIFDHSPGTKWELHTNASGEVIGALLLLQHISDLGFYPVKYFSRKLTTIQ